MTNSIYQYPRAAQARNNSEYVTQHMERGLGTLRLLVFLDIDENLQKTVLKIIKRIFR